MAGIYPLKPVITSNAALGAIYDDHPTSVYYISACMTPQAAVALLDEGAKFQALVLLNGEGEELAERLLPPGDYDPELYPRIERMNLSEANAAAVSALHARLYYLGVSFARRPA